MKNDDLDLAPIKRRALLATPDWSVGYDDDGSEFGYVRGPIWWLNIGPEADPSSSEPLYMSEADAEFAAHAREDVPALVAEIERLRAFRDAVRRYAKESDALYLMRLLGDDQVVLS